MAGFETNIDLKQLLIKGLRAGILSGLSAFILNIDGYPELAAVVAVAIMLEKYIRLKWLD